MAADQAQHQSPDEQERALALTDEERRQQRKERDDRGKALEDSYREFVSINMRNPSRLSPSQRTYIEMLAASCGERITWPESK